MRIVAEWFGITLSQLRKWENEFDILQPKKNARGDRFFRPEDVKNLELFTILSAGESLLLPVQNNI